MIIKAGTYRFNDELTVFTDEHGQYDFPLQFTVRANFAIDTANQLLYEDSQTYEFNTFRFVRVTPPTSPYDYFNVAYLPEIYGTTAVYSYFQSYPVNSYYWNTTAHALESDGYSNTDLAKGFGQTITVTADTEAEDTFGTWFASNTNPVSKQTPAVEITYKDKVVTLKAGQTARLHNADGSPFALEEDLVIKANEVEIPESEGLTLNGIIREYEVNAGASVNAGDFVEFVNKFGNGEFSTDTVTKLSACKLDNSRVLMAYAHTSKSVVVVLSIENGKVVLGEEVQVYGNTLTYFSVTALTSNSAIVAYATQSPTVRFLSIDGINITVGDAITLESVACNSITVVALEENKAFLCYYYNTSSTYGIRGVILSVDGSTITAGSFYWVAYGVLSFKGLALTKLSSTKVFIMYSSDTGTNVTSYAYVCSIDDTVITTGSRASIAGTVDDAYSIFISATALTDSKVVICYSSTNYQFVSCYAYSIEGSTVTQIGNCYFNTNNTGVGVFIKALSEDKVLVVGADKSYALTVALCTIDGTTLSITSIVQLASSTNSSAFAYNSIIPFSETSALVLSSGAESIYKCLTITDTTITVNEQSETQGTFVQPATSNLHNVGVAKTSGAEGKTVEVYCVV